MQLVRSELRKLQTRASFWMFAGALLLILGLVALVLALAPREDLAEDLSFFAVIPNIGFFVPLVVGILLVTGEFWHRTITHTFLATPRRELVLATKFAAAAIAGVAYALISTALTYLLAVPWLAIRDIDLAVEGGEIAKRVALACLTMGLTGILGAGLGALVRHQVAAVVGALVWFLVIENVLAPLLPDFSKYTPGGAVTALNTLTEMPQAILSPLEGGILFAAWAAAFAVAGTLLVVRRDVT